MNATLGMLTMSCPFTEYNFSRKSIFTRCLLHGMTQAILDSGIIEQLLKFPSKKND
jgi:hypothetical protein